MAPIDCHLFIPSVQIYAVSDTIPLHLQLRAPLKSLRAFMSTGTPPLLPPPKFGLGLGLRSSRSSSMTTASSTSLALPATAIERPPRFGPMFRHFNPVR